VEGSSNDNSADVVRNFDDSRIRLIQQENPGVSVARNLGIDEAKAELIAFLDADDEWLPTFLETILRLRKKYPEAGAYATEYKNILIKEKEVKFYGLPKGQSEGLLPSYFKSAVICKNIVRTSFVAIPKKIFTEVGKFAIGVWWGEDVDMWGRIALKYPVAFCSDCKGIYHTDASNRACNRTEPVRRQIFVTSALKALHAGEVPLELKEDLLEYIASKEIQTACRNLKAGRPDLARSNLENLNTKYFKKSFYWILFWTYVPSKIFISLRNLKLKLYICSHDSSCLFCCY
jgi:glycosyltransferase involved in cell wall biosynthesis